ncbi:MAG TPA: hypothetical protein VNS10_23865 [Gemmatimonadaceae bacterium]|jgi:hypothetical protein|nr:hypothetical protein [Gemmatimonadaceae bacterium]
MPEAESKQSGTSQPLDSDPAPLQPTLERAESRLKSALDEACQTDVERVNTGELIRVEEVLAIANEAAKEAVSVRRRLRGQKRGASRRTPAPATPQPSVRDATDPSGVSIPADQSRMREVSDGDRVRWTVFAVYPDSPGKATGRHSVVREPYRQGWLAFTSTTETRRLAPIPEGWLTASEAELVVLCKRAELAPRRAK